MKSPAYHQILLSICFFLLPTINTPAQNQIALDSLKEVIQTTKLDSVKAEALMDLAWQKMYSDSPGALKAAHQGVAILGKVNSLRIEGYAYTVIGVVHWVAASYDSAAYYLNKSADAYIRNKDLRGLSAVYNNLSLIYQNKSDYPKALSFATKALETAEQIGNEQMTANALFTVGNIYYLMEENEKALDRFRKALSIKAKLNDNQNIQKIYLNLGSTFHNLKELDSAAYYYAQCVQKSEVLGDLKALSIASTNLGNLAMDNNEPGKALIHYQKSAEIYQNNLQNDYDHSLLLHSLAKAHMQLGNYTMAENFGKQSLALSEKIDDDKRLVAAHTVLSEIYEKKGDYRNSLAAYKQAQSFRDSIFNIEKAGLLADIETKYETEKKEAQIILQEAEIAEQKANNQRNLILIFSLFIILILVSVLFLLNQNRQKKTRLLLIQQKEIEVKEAYINAALESQELERKRFAQDLHDGFGQLISALRMNISNLMHMENDLVTKSKTVDQIEKILQEMHTEIRNIAFNLMPATLIQFGLKEAVNEFAQRLNSTGKIKILADTQELYGRLTELQEISLYRVIQEWVNNIIKYAQAKEITIQLVRHDEELSVIIEDDGKGFDPSDLEQSEGNGWRNIQSRLHRIKADFEVDSHPNRKGSNLIIDVPVAQLEEDPVIESIVK